MRTHLRLGPNPPSDLPSSMKGVDTILPLHWGTFPQLTGNPDQLQEHLAGTDITVLRVRPGETHSFWNSPYFISSLRSSPIQLAGLVLVTGSILCLFFALSNSICEVNAISRFHIERRSSSIVRIIDSYFFKTLAEVFLTGDD